MFDVRVADTDAAFYVYHPVSAVLASAEEKKCKHLSGAELYNASFTLLLCQLMGHWVMRLYVLQCLADRLSCAWDKNCGHVLMWIKKCI